MHHKFAVFRIHTFAENGLVFYLAVGLVFQRHSVDIVFMEQIFLKVLVILVAFFYDRFENIVNAFADVSSVKVALVLDHHAFNRPGRLTDVVISVFQILVSGGICQPVDCIPGVDPSTGKHILSFLRDLPDFCSLSLCLSCYPGDFFPVIFHAPLVKVCIVLFISGVDIFRGIGYTIIKSRCREFVSGVALGPHWGIGHLLVCFIFVCGNIVDIFRGIGYTIDRNSIIERFGRIPGGCYVASRTMITVSFFNCLF